MMEKLFHPASIALIGGSENREKPGGRLLHHLLSGDPPPLYPVHPTATTLQGVKAYNSIDQLPDIDLGIIAIAAPGVIDVVEMLARDQKCRTFIIISAGFGESGNSKLDQKLHQLVTQYSLTIIGPNCLGVLTPTYNGTFGGPLPRLTPGGVVLISGSGATASFIMEEATTHNLPFSSVITTGNSLVTGVEEVLEYYATMEPPPGGILLYMEAIKHPKKLLQAAQILKAKGVQIAAIKGGSSPRGAAAAASHTGAIATPDRSVDALFQKGGIIRCYNRRALLGMGILFTYQKITGKTAGIITHAGGPGVILTDILAQGDYTLPDPREKVQKQLQMLLYTGASPKNPVDILATGTTKQLSQTIDLMINSKQYHLLVVIFGTPGLRPIFNTYKMLIEKIKNAPIPIIPVLPSPLLAAEEIKQFLSDGGIPFFDEAMAGEALVQHCHSPAGYDEQSRIKQNHPVIDFRGFLPPKQAMKLLKSYNIPVVQTVIATTQPEALMMMEQLGFPLVLKANGLLHKSDAGGVLLNINTEGDFFDGFDKLIALEGATGVVIQPQKSGIELFAGLHHDPDIGMMLLFGFGGIFVEILKDTRTLLLPAPRREIKAELKKLKGFPLLNGARGQKKIPLEPLVELLYNLGQLGLAHPELNSCDLNPVMVTAKSLSVVDFRVEIKK